MKEKSKKIVIFILVFIVLMLLTNVLTRFVLPSKPVIMVSSSMQPTYSDFDILFYSPSDSYYVNDVVLFDSPARNNLIVSRIIEINPDETYKLKGDKNPQPGKMIGEDSVKEEQIVGKVDFSTKWYIYYTISYGIKILLALLLTKFIYSRMKK